MAYKGAWRRLTPSPGDNPNLGTGADNLHLEPQDPRTGYEEPTPPNIGMPGEIFGYASEDFMLPPVHVMDPIDMSPEGHEDGGAHRGRTLLGSQQYANAAHEEDYGAADAQTFSPEIQRAVTDVYGTQRTQADFDVSGSRMALVRGRNAYPENNPDGPPPQGHYVMRWIDRNFTRRSIRTDQQPLRPYRAAVANSLQAPEGATASVYTSPFPNLASARLLKLTTPQVRRIPRQPDEQEESDGTENEQYSNPQYWQGW